MQGKAMFLKHMVNGLGWQCFFNLVLYERTWYVFIWFYTLEH